MQETFPLAIEAKAVGGEVMWEGISAQWFNSDS